jgi:NADPH:quinone reductase
MGAVDMAGVMTMYKTGGPEVFVRDEWPLPEPRHGEVLIRQKAIGLNYQDVYFRMGEFPEQQFPFVNGVEAAGVVEATGPGVDGFAVGDRVAYRHVLGAYAEARVVSEDELVHVSDDVSLEQCAGLLLKGLTADMLVNVCYRVGARDTVLVHAAAGGTGSLVCRLARHRGATVVGIVGSEAKLDAIRPYVDHALLGQDPAIEGRLQEITEGHGVDVVYDGVGRATFDLSMRVVRRFGTVVLYGWASGRPEPVGPLRLVERSPYLIVPSGTNLYTEPEILRPAADRLFDALRSGLFGSTTITTYELDDVARAHADLESRKTSGSIVLVPR